MDTLIMKDLMKQVEKAMDIFELKYPHARGLFLFDNAPSHRKIADNQLNVDKMNVITLWGETTSNERYSLERQCTAHGFR